MCGSTRTDVSCGQPSPRASADIVRSIDPKTFQIPKDATDEGKRMRRSYVDAIRDWVAKGESQ